MKRKHSHGFSLVEVMMAVMILSIALVGLLNAVLYTMRLNELSRQNTLAIQAAKSVAEQLQAHDFSSVQDDFDNTGFDVPGLVAAEGDPDGKVGLVTFDSTAPGLLAARVQVAWRGRTGNFSTRIDLKLTKRK